VCITANRPDTKSNPNPNPNPIPTTEQHAIVSTHLKTCCCTVCTTLCCHCHAPVPSSPTPSVDPVDLLTVRKDWGVAWPNSTRSTLQDTSRQAASSFNFSSGWTIPSSRMSPPSAETTFRAQRATIPVADLRFLEGLTLGTDESWGDLGLRENFLHSWSRTWAQLAKYELY